MAFPLRAAPPARLVLLAAILLISYLCVALSLPVVPVFVTGSLGLGNALAGLAVGVAFLSTILTGPMPAAFRTSAVRKSRSSAASSSMSQARSSR